MEEEHVNSALLGENGTGPNSTLERATLTRRCPAYARTNHTPSCEREMPHKSEREPLHGENTVFWALVGILLLLAGGNLSLTFFAMGVLRLGTGMESIEFLPGLKTTKFFGTTDLENVQKKDGTIYSYADVPFSIVGDDSKIFLSLRTKSNPPQVEVGPSKTEIRNVAEFRVIEPTSGSRIFSTKYPNFGLPRGVKNLNVKRSVTPRITSSAFSDLEIRSDTTIRLKGNEGLHLEGKTIKWSADQDIYLKTLNGSIILDGGAGIFVEVNTLPLAGSVKPEEGDRGQYKLCVCLPKGQLFRVPVPVDNNERTPQSQITCLTFINPCIKAM